MLGKQDFESVKLESTRIVDIEKFVPYETIYRLYWDTLYHLVSSGKTGINAEMLDIAVFRHGDSPFVDLSGMVQSGSLLCKSEADQEWPHTWRGPAVGPRICVARALNSDGDKAYAISREVSSRASKRLPAWIGGVA